MKDANYKSHWNILVFWDQWKMMPDLNMSHGKMLDFVSSSFFVFTLVIKLRYFDFDSHWNALMFFCRKDMTPDLNVFHIIISDFVSSSLF